MRGGCLVHRPILLHTDVSRSFECFLEPLSSCPQEPIHTRLQKRRRGWKTVRVIVLPIDVFPIALTVEVMFRALTVRLLQGDITAAHLEAIFSKLCERFGLASVIDLHMHLLAYIMRPRRQLCQKMLEVAQESFSLSTPSSWWSADLSVHLRTGDKHELGDELLSKFVLAMDKMFPSGPFHGRGLFSSDDFGAIEAFKHALGMGGGILRRHACSGFIDTMLQQCSSCFLFVPRGRIAWSYF